MALIKGPLIMGGARGVLLDPSDLINCRIPFPFPFRPKPIFLSLPIFVSFSRYFWRSYFYLQLVCSWLAEWIGDCAKKPKKCLKWKTEKPPILSKNWYWIRLPTFWFFNFVMFFPLWRPTAVRRSQTERPSLLQSTLNAQSPHKRTAANFGGFMHV